LPGCPLPEDGRFTGRMERAVLAFQQQVFADPARWDGTIGPATKAQLDLLAGAAVPAPADTAEAADDGFAEGGTPYPCAGDLSAFGQSGRAADMTATAPDRQGPATMPRRTGSDRQQARDLGGPADLELRC